MKIEVEKMFQTVGSPWVGMAIIAHAASQTETVIGFRGLRLRYYGEQRAAETKSTRSFDRLRRKALDLGIIVRSGTKYALGEEGKELLAYVADKGIDVATLKSKAQTAWELTH